MVLARIRALAIPPAWIDVWISPTTRSHIQATGRDARRRKQYIYHAAWRAQQEQYKFDRLIEFGRTLPRLRRRVQRDLRNSNDQRSRVIAAVVALLDQTAVRIGNKEYARANGTYGLTTLRNRHVDVHGDTIRMRFRSKSGKQQEVELTHRRLARIIKTCQELPGQELFTYLDQDGAAHPVLSQDVNQYLREITGLDVTAKDYRTWTATVLTFDALRLNAASKATKRDVTAAIGRAAKVLGNTVTVCRASYVHPAVISLAQAGKLDPPRLQNGPTGGLRSSEQALLSLLSRRRRPTELAA